jgi:hypothetical protein
MTPHFKTPDTAVRFLVDNNASAHVKNDLLQTPLHVCLKKLETPLLRVRRRWRGLFIFYLRRLQTRRFSMQKIIMVLHQSM